jgi:hypothetical protein
MLRAILLGAMIAFASANVDATWYGLQNCDNSGSVTTVNSPPTQCNLVPGSTATGYKLTCNDGNNNGVFSVCNDAACTDCPTNTPFNNNQCLANPSGSGSASAKFSCNGASGGNNGAGAVTVAGLALAGAGAAAAHVLA